MARTIIDYSAGVPSAAAIKAAGHIGAARYISPARPEAKSWMKGKPMSRSEATALQELGLEIVSIWQHLKEDWRRGESGGYTDGKAAIDGHRDAGGPEGCVIYCAIDSNPTGSEWDRLAKGYVIGFRQALREHGFRIGIYCNTTCHAWADRDGIPHYWWAHNWGSDSSTSQAHIHQFEIDQRSIDGVGIDRNYVQHDDFGQWSQATGQPKQKEEVAPIDTPTIIDRSQEYGFGGWRSTDDIQAIFVHTTENTLATPAENIVSYQTTPGQVGYKSGSYHVLVDLTKLIRCNTDNWITWSTGNKGNQVGLHISFLAYAHFTREQWLEQTDLLLRGAWQVAEWVKEHNLPIIFVGGDGLRAGNEGISTHNEARIAWGVTTHTDPGAGFPMDVFIDMVADYVDGNLGTQEEGFLMALTHDEQYEALGILRQLKQHYLDPKASEVAGSKFKAPVHKMIVIGDRKLEELHVKYTGEQSEAQRSCDDRQAEHEAATADHEEDNDAN